MVEHPNFATSRTWILRRVVAHHGRLAFFLSFFPFSALLWLLSCIIDTVHVFICFQQLPDSPLLLTHLAMVVMYTLVTSCFHPLLFAQLLHTMRLYRHCSPRSSSRQSEI
jgi:hypothetical protein